MVYEECFLPLCLDVCIFCTYTQQYAGHTTYFIVGLPGIFRVIGSENLLPARKGNGYHLERKIQITLFIVV
jgi:hypothetical protein